MTSASEPRLLILETSGRVGQVAVAAGDKLLEARQLDQARRHARDLAPTVAQLLSARGWKARDLDAIIVSRGPGSYTGLRVGIMAAKTLAFATGCAFIAVDTFAAIAAQAPVDVLRLDVLADAQQEKVYVQSFARASANASLMAVGALGVQSLGTWLGQRQPGDWVSGPGVRAYRHLIPPDVPVLGEELWDPRAESLLQLGLARFRAGERDDFWRAEPLYARPSSAEEKWQARTSDQKT